MAILNQSNLLAQAVISNGLVTGNPVQNPQNLLNTTDSTALFSATSDVIIGNFPFSLPLDAVIVGISGKMKARIDDSSIPAGSLTPVLVDSTSGSNQYYPGTPVTGLSNVLQEYDLGGEYDIWGNLAWTPTKINNLKLQLVGNSPLEAAWATLTVFYYIPVTTPTPSPFDLPGCADCDSEIQALPFRLKRVWRSNETTLLLESFRLPDGTPITLSMLGECGGTINITIDPDLRKEDGGNFIENFNLLDSIASITPTAQGVELDIGDITQRGLGFSTPYGHDADNVSEHGVGAILIITNNGPYNNKLLKKCHIGTLVSAPIDVLDEGTEVVVSMEKLNFIGPNVQAEQDPGDPRQANVTFNGAPTNVTPTMEDTATGTTDTTPALTLTVPLTVVSANYLRVAVITEDETITGVTYNGVAMTAIGEQANPGANLKVALFGLINPASGAHNAVVTMPTLRKITAIVTSWLDVDTASPVDGLSAGNTGSDDAPTDSVTTTTDNTVVQDVVGTTNNPTTFTQFGLWSIQGDVNTGDRPGASSSRRVLSPGLVTDTYSISLATDWAILLAGIRGISSPVPVAGVSTVTGTYIDNTDPNNPVSVVPLNNTDVIPPTVSDDETLGYAVDSQWFDSATGTLYTCEDPTTGAAVWTAISGGAADGKVLATAADTTSNYLDDKIEIVSLDSSVGITKTIQNPAADEKISYDLSVAGTVSEKKVGVGEYGDIAYFNIQLPWITSASDPVNLWNPWRYSGYSSSVGLGSYLNVSTAAGSVYSQYGILKGFSFDSNKQAICQYIAQYTAGETTDSFHGFIGNVGSATAQFYNDGGVQLYARTQTGGGGGTTLDTAITGVTLTDRNVFRIEMDPNNATPQVRFYVNGVLKATNTTSLPFISTNEICFNVQSIGSSTNGLDYVTAPSFALEL